MPMTDSYIDVMLGDKSHRIQIRHEDRPCDAYIAVDGQQVSSRLKMLPYNGGAHYFEVDGHQLVLVIARSDSDQPWEYDCFVDDVSVVNGMPFWFGKADLVTVRRWEKSRREDQLLAGSLRERRPHWLRDLFRAFRRRLDWEDGYHLGPSRRLGGSPDSAVCHFRSL